MKIQKRCFLLMLSVGMLGACMVATPDVSAQSGSSSRPGGGSRSVQQGSSTRQGSTSRSLGGSTLQGGSSSRSLGGSSLQQGSTSRSLGGSTLDLGSTTKKTAVKAKKSFEQKLWSYINSTRYDQWAPAGDNGDFRRSDRAHGAFVKTYMNRRAAGSPTELPYDSIIVKENFSAEKKLVALTLMYRVKGYNPDANGWYWIKYNPDGSIAMMDSPTGKIKIAGKAKGCIECHSGADGDDYVFFND